MLSTPRPVMLGANFRRGARFSFVVMPGLGYCAVVSHWSAFSPRLTWQSSGTGRRQASLRVAGIINIPGFVAHRARPGPYFYVRAHTP